MTGSTLHVDAAQSPPAADTANSRLVVLSARTASNEGDPRHETRLTLPTRSGERVIPLGCIMVRGV